MTPDTDPIPHPTATVVVCSRDRAESLTQTLTALRAQDHPNFEVVVVDNDSTDRTPAVIEEFGARRVLVAGRFGIGHCRQQGVEAARGKIVAFCDDDTIPSPGWLSALSTRLESDRTVGLVGGQVINIGFEGLQKYKGQVRLGPNGKCAWEKDPAATDCFGNMNLAFRRDVVQSIGGYDPFMNVMEEIDLTVRVKRAGYRIVHEPSAVLEHFNRGRFFKKRHVFHGSELVRLYFVLKNFRPGSARGWAQFARQEARLIRRDVIRFTRAVGGAVVNRRTERFGVLAIWAFNIVSSRMAIPWLLYRTRASARVVAMKGGAVPQ